MTNEIANDNDANFDHQKNLNSWWNLDVGSLREVLFKQVGETFEAEISEPKLYAATKSRPSSAGTSLMLFLFSIARLESLHNKYGNAAWTGSQDPFRLPPKVLIAKEKIRWPAKNKSELFEFMIENGKAIIVLEKII